MIDQFPDLANGASAVLKMAVRWKENSAVHDRVSQLGKAIEFFIFPI
jgi:hypothetical protein